MGAHTLARNAAGGMGSIEEDPVSGRPSSSACRCGHKFSESDPAGVACPNCGAVRPLLVAAADNVAVGVQTQTELWIAASFAASWFRDAVVEASATGLDPRRREIVF